VILADSSAWVEYDRATGSPVHRRLRQLLDDDQELACTEPVIMEVVAGARDDARALSLRRLLWRAHLLPFHATIDFEGALRIFRHCRAKGITPRNFVDCMIASVASRQGAAVLAHDVDFSRIASVIDLRLDEASVR